MVSDLSILAQKYLKIYAGKKIFSLSHSLLNSSCIQLCIMGELAEGGSVAVTGARWLVTPDLIFILFVIFVKDFFGIGTTISTGWEIQCLLYAGLSWTGSGGSVLTTNGFTFSVVREPNPMLMTFEPLYQ